MNVLDLFSGVGGFSLGLERAGLRTVAFCEIDPYCQRVLRKHWPDVPVYNDVRSLTAERLTADGIAVDVTCGGFPCQDVSLAGKGAGITGERSGLWKEYARIIGEVRPRYIIVENVRALLVRGISTVLGDLSILGYDAEWQVISAQDVGAPHRRDRIWIIAYADQPRLALGELLAGLLRQAGSGNAGQVAAMGDWWRVEPDVCRVAHGVPSRVDRLRALGNAVVPQIPEIIGHAIMAQRAS